MQLVSASFRDRSGYVFSQDQKIYRTVNTIYQPHYEHLHKSGLYNHLTKRKLFLSFEENESIQKPSNVWKVLEPTQLSQISYASEWSFNMLKDAARCTLYNCLEALEYGMILKDANTFNIQFHNGKPILIDSLSFELYDEEKPWVAYRQFVEHFLCPLLLMKYNHQDLQKMLLAYPNGIPVDVCKSLLPAKAKLNPNAYLHIYLASTKKKNNKGADKFSKQKMITLLNGLLGFVNKIDIKLEKTVWDDYYSHTILGNNYLEEKQKVVREMLSQISFNKVVDYGANDGQFSMLCADMDKEVVAADIDYNCIDRLYKKTKSDKIKNIHPLVLDLTAPTPSFGWAAKERETIFTRLTSDLSLCLALVHHLAIQHNIPLPAILDLFYEQSEYLLIEFVEKTDDKVKILLENREDVFDQYTLEDFKKEISKRFAILSEKRLNITSRTLFLLKRKDAVG